MKIADQGQFNQVVVQALHNLYALHLNPDAVLAQDYGTGASDVMVRSQMADLERFAFYPAHEPPDVAPELPDLAEIRSS